MQMFNMDEFIGSLFNEIDLERVNGCTNKPEDVDSCPRCCQAQYYPGHTIDYTCPQKMSVYTVRFFPVHAAEVYNAISISRTSLEVTNLLNKSELYVLSMGGGPGADIHGARRAIREVHRFNNNMCSVMFTRAEINSAWDFIFERAKCIGLSSQNITETYQSFHVDLAMNDNTLFPPQDVILVSYLISELSDEQAIVLAGKIKSSMHSNTVVIINDRPEYALKDRIRAMIEVINPRSMSEINNRGWGQYSFSLSISNFMMPKFNMSSDSFVLVGRL